MTYAQYGIQAAADYNSHVLSVNAVWSTGNRKSGYGQTALSNVAQSAVIGASEWVTLINTIAYAGSVQGTALTAITGSTTPPLPQSGKPIYYNSVIPTNITAIGNGKGNAAAQGTTSSTATRNSSTWSTALTFTHTITFASGDAARYFFNAGGQIALSMSHPTGSAIDNLLNTLATAVGTIYISSPDSGTVSIGGTAFNGVQRVGGGGNGNSTTTTNWQNYGYYGMNTTSTQIWKQTATGSPAGYIGTFIAVSIRTNNATGSYGDNGSTITITTVWDEIPAAGLTAAAGTTVTATIRPPSTNYLPTVSWGTPSNTGTVSGS